MNRALEQERFYATRVGIDQGVECWTYVARDCGPDHWVLAARDSALVGDREGRVVGVVATHDGWSDNGFDIADACFTLYNGPPDLEDCTRTARIYANDLEMRCHPSLPCDLTKCVVDELP